MEEEKGSGVLVSAGGGVWRWTKTRDRTNWSGRLGVVVGVSFGD